MAIHRSQRFFHCWNASWNALYVMARSSLIIFYSISTMVWKRRPLKVGLSLGNRKSLLALTPENRMDGAQRMSDVLPDNCGWGATRDPAHCRCATSKSGFPTIQASFCTQLHSNSLKLPGTTVCLPSDHVVQIHDGQCLSNQKTQPISPWSLTDSSGFFFWGDPFPIHGDYCILVSTSYP